MDKNTSNKIIESLNEIIPNPKCELNFNNNFELICAVMLSAQTTDKRVNIITEVLFKQYPNPASLSKASYGDIFEIIKPLGLAGTKTKNIIALSEYIDKNYNGIVPSNFDELIKLPGVGRKTANVVLALGFKIPAFPVDTHVSRVAYRLKYSTKNDDILSIENKLKKYIDKDIWIDAHHLFLLFGRYHCKAINPSCDNCKLKEFCRKRG